ncbi:DUF3999 family protein [Aquimarina muelleri]|uniref:DUF3999 domain-containing protein n=1 Tax=Aquimarina muelleri TaxID=279356 RepID=A0A918JT99_9FLAO|nr:DUF3999 family protein [Aquimarina muelleri]MCX2761965.1 DUF3999 family protein [Aquimarina muelleri]GGX10724.1 hypothetical protein GCM10007384_10570 [Aquimarina muelleri]
MKKKIKFINFFILLFFLESQAQINQYAYKSILPDVTDTWYAICLPNEVFGKVSSDLSDIRIYGITNKKDTIEAPYLLRLRSEKVSKKTIPFSVFNTTYNNKEASITLKIPSKEPINQIQLDFEEPNFDRLITLEGSQNLTEWYVVEKDYRILSIKNEFTNYQFTTVRFSKTLYNYFRIRIKSDKKPVLRSANVIIKEVDGADYQEYDVASFDTQNPKNIKKTIIDLALKTAVPISSIYLQTEEDFDYYRPLSIKYLADSIQTQQGVWKPLYKELTSGVLSSVEKNIFPCRSTIAKKIRITIDNHDNQPLKINKVRVKGYKHELVARFTNPATYYLVYGNKKARKPVYDLNYLSTKIPKGLPVITPDKAQVIKFENTNTIKPLFMNKIWLWSIMLIVILVLGGFTLSMMKKK